MKRHSWSNQTRFEGTGSLICMCLAVFLSVSTMTVAAQTAFEFEDPLADARAKIERTTSGDTATDDKWAPRSVSSDVTGGSDEQTDARPEIKGPATVIAERLGVPTGALFVLLALAILGLLLGLRWWMGRRRTTPTTKRKDRDLYAVVDGSRARRSLESGAKISRNRSADLDTSETDVDIPEQPSVVPTAAASTVAAEAARILSDGPDEPTEALVTETYGAEPKSTAKEVVTATAAVASAPVDPKDPSTWQRPNLDRLKESIRDDWKGSKIAEPEPEKPAAHAEEKGFASMYVSAAEREQTADTEFSSIFDTPEIDRDDDDAMSVSDLRAVVEKSAASDADTISERLRRPMAPSREDALRRIKALRESVKAG